MSFIDNVIVGIAMTLSCLRYSWLINNKGINFTYNYTYVYEINIDR